MDFNWILEIMRSPWILLFFLPLVGYFCWHNVYDYNDLADVVTAIGANEGTIFVPNEIAVTADLTIPANVTLRFIQGGSLNISAGKTVTINGHIEAGLYQIFEGSGSVSFGSGAIEKAYPEWWGAAADGVTDDTAELLAAIASGKIVVLQAGETYIFSSNLDLNQENAGLISLGIEATLKTPSDIIGVTISAQRTTAKNFRVEKTGTISTTSGIKFVDGVYRGEYRNLSVVNFKDSFEFYADTLGIAYNELVNLYGYGATGAVIYIHESGAGWVNENSFLNCCCSPAAAGRSVIAEGSNNKFLGCAFEGVTAFLHSVHELGYNVYDDCRFEAPSGYGILFENPSTGLMFKSRLTQSHYECLRPFFSLQSGVAEILDHHFSGTLRWDFATPDRVTTAVDADSNSGQKVLNVTSTARFYRKDSVLVDEGGDREEWCCINTIQDGISLTMENNLRYTHTAVQADAVIAKGRLHGIEREVGKNTLDKIDRFKDGEKETLEGSLVWDPANLIDGAGETSAGITVVGAAIGDAIIVYPPYDMQDVLYRGYVQAADTVEIRIQNESGGARDLASATWKVKVLKY